MVVKLHRDPLVAKIGEHMKRRAAPPTAMFPAVKLRLATPEKESPEVPKKKQQRRKFDDAYRAKIVARILAGKESGEETRADVGRAEGLPHSLMSKWVLAAQEANATPDKGKPGPKGKGDIKALSRELADAMERVSAIKKKLRKLLGDD